MKVGVTANQHGITDRQKCIFLDELTAIGATELHHGDCIGGDLDCHYIAAWARLAIKIVIHPPRNESKRAFLTADEYRKPLEYLDRNKNIVLETDVLYGFPRFNREELRSGTWSTIRFARKLNRPYFVVLPYD